MQLQVTLQKIEKITDSEGNKQQTRFHLTHFRGFELRKKLRLMFLKTKEKHQK